VRCHDLNEDPATTCSQEFTGEKIRTWPGKGVFLNKQEKPERSPVRIHDHTECEKWSVVTTIHNASEGIRRAAKAPGWCLVIVGDTKTSKDLMVKMQAAEDQMTDKLKKEANQKKEEEE